MVVVLQAASVLAFIAAVVIAYKNISNTDFMAGGFRHSISPLMLPLAVYILGGGLLVVDVFLMASSGALTNQLLTVGGVVFVMLASGGLIFALFLQTVKSQSRSAAAGNIINLLRRSQNDSVSSAGEKAAETLDTRADPDQDPGTEHASESTQSGQRDTSTPTETTATETTTETVSEASKQTSEPADAVKSTTQTDSTTGQVTAAEPSPDAEGVPSSLRRFEFTLYLLSLVPLLLVGVAYIQSTAGIESSTGGLVAAAIVGISVLIALLGVAVRKRWRIGYYAGLWTCGLIGFGGLFMLFQPDALRVLGVTFVVGALGVYWGSNSKPYF